MVAGEITTRLVGEITASNALVKLLRLQQLTGGSLVTDDGTREPLDDSKEKLLRDTLQDLEPPVVVFCRFRDDLDRVASAAATLEWSYGEISGHRKDGLDDQGRLPDGLQAVGGQMQAGGVGVDLSRSRVGIVYSAGFSLGDYLQARGRLDRHGQRGENVTFIHLVARDTVDETVMRALARRQEVIESVLNREPGDESDV